MIAIMDKRRNIETKHLFLGEALIEIGF